jgi:hypothetical protein
MGYLAERSNVVDEVLDSNSAAKCGPLCRVCVLIEQF